MNLPKKSQEKKRSIWWSHFKETDIDDISAGIYCQAKISCPTKYGTSPLKNHIMSCHKYPANIDKKQKLIDLESRVRVSDDGSVETMTVPK